MKIILFFILFFPFATFADIGDSGTDWHIQNNCVVENRCTTIQTEDYKIYRIEPLYPIEALEKHIEGYIDLEFTMNPNGKASDFEITRSDPLHIFDEAATQAVQKWYFKAISERSKSESIRAVQKMIFKLKGLDLEHSQYVISTGILKVPVVNVIDQFGTIITYKALMKLKPSNKMTFELVKASEKLENIKAIKQIIVATKNGEPKDSQYTISTGLLEIPAVDVIDQFGKVITYKVTMKLKSLNNKMTFELVEAFKK